MDPPECVRLHPRTASTRHDTMRSYVAVLFTEFRSKVLLTLGLVVCIGLMECLALLLLVPLLNVLGVNLGKGTASRLAEICGNVLARAGLAPTLTTVLPVYIGVVAGRALLQRCQSITITDLQSSFVRSLRRRLFQSIVRTRWVFFAKTRSSAFLQALTSETGRVGQATDHVLPLVSQIFIVVVYLLFALALSPLITLLVFATGIALLLLLRREARRAFATGERMTVVTGRLYAAAIEPLNGFKTVRSYRGEDRTAELFDDLQRDVVKAEVAAQRNFARVKLGFEVGAVLVLGAMLWLAVEAMALAVAEVLLLIYLFGRVVPRLSALQQSHQYFVNALPAFRNVMQMIEDCEGEAEPRSSDGNGAIRLNHAIRLQRVSFSYGPQTVPAIQDLDLEIPAHRTTAIVGLSGAGKTTIADLLMGLIAPNSGRILVDDVLLGPRTIEAWRDQIGYVPQDTFLFHDTIRANLLWARPDATEGDLREALRLASADPFVDRLPNGLNTVIGDRGVLLSGGERQRLALARALLRRPALLILDEATNSLDSENERQIQRAIEHLHGRTTILVITHRLSTIREADAIHVVENGRLIESGGWQALIRADGRFMDLCRAQRIAGDRLPRKNTKLIATGS